MEVLQTRTLVAQAPPAKRWPRAGPSVFGLNDDCWGEAVTARAEVEGHSLRHVAALWS